MNKLKTIMAATLCLSLVSCGGPMRTGKESYKSQGEKIEDVRAMNEVKLAFKENRQIPNDLIHVAIDRGIVQLSGFVKTHEQSNMAYLATQALSRVKHVINSMIVLEGAEYAKIRANAERFHTAR